MPSDLTYSFLVDKTPTEVFNAVTNVRGWWSEEIEGDTQKAGDQFMYHFEDVHRCEFEITESIPNKKLVWHVIKNYFNFTQDKSEWTGNNMIFEITTEGSQTKFKFTQQGLVPHYECYSVCSNAWDNYINKSLKSLIETGKGQPNATGKPQTENEKKLSSK